MVCPMPSFKEPAKAKALSKAKGIASVPPPKKRNGVEATSGIHSGKGKQIASVSIEEQP